MDHESLHKYVVGAQLGDVPAFEWLAAHYYPRVFRFALSRARSRSAAEEITQEVFLLAWANLHRLRHARAFGAWLRRIARNVIVNWIRNEDYRRRLSQVHGEVCAMHAGPADPAEALSRQELYRHVQAALAELSPKLRDAATLYYMEGKSIAESARVLGISAATMKKRLHLARARLARQHNRRNARLESLLPYSQEALRRRIRFGLAGSPAAPSLGEKLTDGWWLSIRETLTRQLFPTTNAANTVFGLVKTAASTVLTVSIIYAAAVGATLKIYSAPIEDDAEVILVKPNDGRDYYEGTGVINELMWGDPVHGDHVRLALVFPGYPSHIAGLRAGDRLIEINGHRITRQYWSVIENRMAGPAGTTANVTVMRPQPDGSEKKLHFEVTRGYVPWDVRHEWLRVYRALHPEKAARR